MNLIKINLCVVPKIFDLNCIFVNPVSKFALFLRKMVKFSNGDTEEFPDAAVLDPRMIKPLDRVREVRVQEASFQKSKTFQSRKSAKSVGDKSMQHVDERVSSFLFLYSK